MKTLCISFVLSTIALLSACTDLGDQVPPELSVTTKSLRYRSDDTLRFDIVNSLSANCYLISCNRELTFWLQGFNGDAWIDLVPVNIGPCLDFGARNIILIPGQSITERLPLETLSVLLPGRHRIKIEYIRSAEATVKYAHSNPFEIED